MSEPIFELNDKLGHYYHGIFTGFIDSRIMAAEMGVDVKSVASAELFGMIWNDEQNKYMRACLKFKSGNKIRIEKIFNYNESIQNILATLNDLKLQDRQYYPCNTGSVQEMLEIMRKEDLVLSETVITK